jgi:hypothetical protein
VDKLASRLLGLYNKSRVAETTHRLLLSATIMSSLEITFTDFMQLRQRSQYFSSRSATRNVAFDFSKYPIVYITIPLLLPTFIGTDENQILRILYQLSKSEMDFDMLFYVVGRDIQTLVLMLDYFQFEIWPQVFRNYMPLNSFHRKNSFLQIILKTFPSHHHVIDRAFLYVSELLTIPFEKLSQLRTKHEKDCVPIVMYLRSVYRTKITEKAFNYRCKICLKIIYSRRTLPHFNIDKGQRYSCCGSPVCNLCALSIETVPFCPYCDNPLSDDKDFNILWGQTLHATMKKNSIRESHGIPRNAILTPLFPIRWHFNF